MRVAAGPHRRMRWTVRGRSAAARARRPYCCRSGRASATRCACGSISRREMTGVQRTSDRRGRRAIVVDDDEDVLARNRRGRGGRGDDRARRHRFGDALRRTDERGRAPRRAADGADARVSGCASASRPTGSVGMTRRRRRIARGRAGRVADARGVSQGSDQGRRELDARDAAAGRHAVRRAAVGQAARDVPPRLADPRRASWAFVSMRGEMQPATRTRRRRRGRCSRKGRRERDDAASTRSADGSPSRGSTSSCRLGDDASAHDRLVACTCRCESSQHMRTAERRER